MSEHWPFSLAETQYMLTCLIDPAAEKQSRREALTLGAENSLAETLASASVVLGSEREVRFSGEGLRRHRTEALIEQGSVQQTNQSIIFGPDFPLVATPTGLRVRHFVVDLSSITALREIAPTWARRPPSGTIDDGLLRAYVEQEIQTASNKRYQRSLGLLATRHADRAIWASGEERIGAMRWTTDWIPFVKESAGGVSAVLAGLMAVAGLGRRPIRVLAPAMAARRPGFPLIVNSTQYISITLSVNERQLQRHALERYCTRAWFDGILKSTHAMSAAERVFATTHSVNLSPYVLYDPDVVLDVSADVGAPTTGAPVPVQTGCLVPHLRIASTESHVQMRITWPDGDGNPIDFASALEKAISGRRELGGLEVPDVPNGPRNTAFGPNRAWAAIESLPSRVSAAALRNTTSDSLLRAILQAAARGELAS